MKKLLKKEGKSIPDMQRAVYWFIILGMVVLTLVLSVWFVPVLMLMKGWLSFLIIFLLGLSFGALFNNLIMHLEHLDHHHTLFGGFLIIVLAACSFYVMSKAAFIMSVKFALPLQQNPVEIALFYVVGFIIPYSYGLLYKIPKR